MAEQGERSPGVGTLLNELPMDELKKGVFNVATALADRAAGSLTNRLEGVAERLTESAGNGGKGLLSAVTGGGGIGGAVLKSAVGGGLNKVKDKAAGLLGGGKAGGGKKRANVVNIVEHIDVGLPLRVVYDQWTQFEEFPSWTRKVNSVEQESDEKLLWKAQIFLSHRDWEATIVEQVPDERIVWTSKAAKGTVDGSVTFHELAPNMTRVLLVIEYRPKGFFEKTGNLWRAQGRRVRSDLRHIKRHMMTRTILEQDKIEGWRGEIRDAEVVRSHEDALRDEEEYATEEQGEEYGSEERDEDERGYEDEYEDYGGGEDYEPDEEESGERDTRRRERVRSGAGGDR
ncbi:polyketide cyclase [Saccharopolyspora subtropica]|uniref:Polyketide cyclase n=1 Tax=Saccharopolyspora thermophila TaxID=89367 RepID=A0A917JUJ3_9PSEU|nr:SRPBCC family protein [Saccharopolyspora subtropica]GGI87410.1 polyketide cyclase [Saccharopolyspora subtropica]